MLIITLLLMLILCLLLAWDVTAYRLPNLLIISLVLLYIPYAYIANFGLVTLAMNAGVFLMLLLLGMGMFALKMVGGGDAKFIAVAGLWAGYAHMHEYLLYMALFGGVMTLALLILRPILAKMVGNSWLATHLPMVLRVRAPVPYGVAISGALLTLMAQEKISGLVLF